MMIKSCLMLETGRCARHSRSTMNSWPRLKAFTGLKEKSSLVREALKALIERESARRLARLGGSEPDLEAPPRRRPFRRDPGRYLRLGRPSALGRQALAGLLESGMVLAHPFVIGELSLGNLRQREAVLTALSDLPAASIATDAEVLHFIDRHTLFGRGVGYIDTHLLAAVRLTAGAALWTNDKRLHGVAVQLGLAALPPRRQS